MCKEKDGSNMKEVKMADGSIRLIEVSNSGPAPYTAEWYEAQRKKREELAQRGAGTC